jgi:hypothetical protein
LRSGVKPNRLDRRWCVAEAGTAALTSSREDLVDVEAGFSFVGERVDELVVNRLS